MSPADLISPGGTITQEQPVTSTPLPEPQQTEQQAPKASNSLIAEYRNRAPWDPRTDAQLMEIFGNAQDQDGRYNNYPDFVQQWDATKEPIAGGPNLPPREPGVIEEAARGAVSGTRGLASTAVGLAALGAGAVGAEETKKKLVEKFSQMEQQSAEDGPTIRNVEDITGPETAARYVFGKAGELVPNIASAALMGLAGAAAGTAVEPGGGTLAGGAGGFLEGFVARKAAQSVLKGLLGKTAEEIIPDAVARKVATEEIKNLVETGVSKSLSTTAQKVLQKEAGAIAQRYGANAVVAAGFFGQSAGGEYGNLAAQGLKDDDARTAALIAGLGGAGAIFLPAAVTKRLFPSMGEVPANEYVKRLASDAIKEIPAAASGMGLMEVANVAADRVAHPDTMDAPLTHQELMRILNASVVGAMAGGVTAPLTALKGPEPAQRFDPVVEEHFKNVPDVRRQEIQQLKGRRESGNASLEDEAAFKALSPEEAKFYAVAKPSQEATADEGGTSPGADINPERQPGKRVELEPAAGGTVPPAAKFSFDPNRPLTLQDLSDADPEEYFHAKQALDRQVIADPKSKQVIDYLKEAIQQNPDPNAWKEALEKTRKEGEAIKDEIASNPKEAAKAFAERQTELMGTAFKASFLGDGFKVAQALVDAETARKRAAALKTTPTDDPLVEATRKRAEAKLQAARDKTETNPSVKQLLAENYQKGKYNLTEAGLPGMVFSLENPKGTERSPADGAWKVTMPGDYGYLLGTKGKDKDHVDMTIGPNHEAPEVYVIDQIDPKTGKFDEHKTFLGYGSKAQAETAYDASFSDGSGPKRRGAITTMTKPEFQKWVTNKKLTKKPLGKEIFHAEQKPGTEPAVARSTEPEVAPKLEGPGQAAAGEGSAGVPGGGQGAQPEKPAGEGGKAEAPKPAEGKVGTLTEEQFQEGLKLMGQKSVLSPMEGESQEAWLARISKPEVIAEGKAQTAEVEKFLAKVEKPAEPERQLKTKPTAQKTRGEVVKEKIAEKEAKIEQHQTALAELLGPADESWKNRPDAGFVLNPLDLVHAIKPDVLAKALPHLTGLAKEVFELGAYKFEDFAREMIKRGGEQLVPYVTSLYEAARNYWKSVLGDAKANADYKFTAKYVLDKMTPLGDMADEVQKAADRYRGKEGPLVYEPGHAITHADVDFETRGVRGFSARGRDNEEVRKLWEKERASERRVEEETRFRAGLKGEAKPHKTPDLPPWEDLDDFQKEAFYESLPPKEKVRIEQLRSKETFPAWFEPKGKGEKLEAQLLSESSPPSKIGGKATPNTMTYRLADILDRQTGKVHRVSVFKNNDVANVTKFDEALGTKKNKRAVPLQTVLDTKDDQGKARYKVVGSVRTKGLTQYYDEEFRDEKVYRKQFTDEANKQQAAAESTAAAMAKNVEAAGFSQEAMRAKIDAETEKSMSDLEPEQEQELLAEQGEVKGKAEQAQTEAAMPEPKELNLEPGDVKRLREELPAFDSIDELAEKIQTPEVSDELYNLIKDVLKQDRTFFNRVQEGGLENTLKDYGYNIDTGAREQNQPGALREAQAGVRPTGQRGGPGAGESKANLEGGQNRPGTVPGQVQGGPGGNKIPNRATKTTVTLQRAKERGSMEQTLAAARKHAAITSGLFPEEETRLGAQKPFKPAEGPPVQGPIKPSHEQPPLPSTSPWTKLRQPTGTEGNTSPEHAALVLRIHEAAAKAGIDVQTVRGELGAGAYDPKNRALLQVLGNTVGSEDVKTAFHEVGHDVFAQLPKDEQDSILRGVSKITDRAIGIDYSADSRINLADPENLGTELHEERLVESMAQNLAAEGFDPARAKGLAQQFVRRLKDLFMQAALKVQRMLGIPESGELARRYFENRVKMLLAGDGNNLSYVDFIGARKLAPWERFKEAYNHGTNTTAERFSSDGQVEYEHVPDLSTAASLFNMDANGLKYRMPDDKYSLQTEVEKRAALLNHLQERIETAVEALTPEIRKAIEEAKTTPEEYVRRLLRIDDPLHARELLSQEKEVDGSPVEFDKEKRIEDFKGKGNRDQTYIKAYSNTQGMLSRLGKAMAKSEDTVKEVTKQRDKASESLAKQIDVLKELKEAAKDKTKEIKGLPMQLGLAKQRINQARKVMSAADRAIQKENLKIAAIKAITPGLREEHARLTGILEVRPDFQFVNGRKYVVPETPGEKTEDLAKQTKTLKLDSTGKLTDPASIREDLRKMKEFTAQREQQAAAGDVHALDYGYQAVRQAMHEMMARSATYSTEVMPFNRWKWVHGLLPDGKRMAEAFNTPVARSIMRRWHQYASILERFHPLNERGGRITGQMEGKLMELLPKMRLEQFRKDILDHVRDMLKNQSDLAERHANDPAAYRRAVLGRVKADLLERHLVPDSVIDKFMPKLGDLLDHQWNLAKERLRPIQEARLGVEDTRMRGIINPATGEKEVATRRHAAIGSELWGTFPRKIAGGFSTMVRALRASGWDNLKDLLQSGPEGSPSKLREALAEGKEDELLAPFFNDAKHGNEVKETFFRNLADMPDKSTFFAPREAGVEPLESEEEEEGAILPRHPADPTLVRKAMEETGPDKPVEFARRLFELHEGQGDKDEYVEDVLRTLANRYSEANGMFKRYEPGDSVSGNWGIAGMSPDALIDARTIEHLPGEWFDYHAYDRRESFSMSQRIAAELAFGRGQKGLASDFETLKKEALAARTRLDEVTHEVKQANPEASPRDVRHLVKDRLGLDADRILKHADRFDLIDRTGRSISDYFRKESDPGLAIWGPTRIAHGLGQLMVQQPASAINLLEQLFAMNMRYGAGGSVIGGTARTIKYVGQEAINSLAQAIGMQTEFGADKYQYWKRLGLTDPNNVRSVKDAFDPQTSERPLSQFIRGIEEFTGVTMNKLGAKAEHIAFQPFQPFSWVAALSDYGLTRSLWDMTGTQIAKGMEYYRQHPELLEDQAHRLDSDKLGLKRGEKHAFDQLTRDMGNWDMDYDTMVRNAMKRGDGKPFTDEEAQKLYGLSLSNLLSESSVATMPTNFFNNPVLKFIAPLIGWSFRRSALIAETGKTEEGRRSWQALSHGLAGLGIMAAGGLGVSAAVNMYSEDLLGKKRNLRPIIGADPEQTALGIMENLNRVGSLGLFGELANGMINVGTGADNRMIDLDQRVVALSALSKLQDVASAIINQRDVDYAHVVRPLMGAMGGGGALQYMQLANHTLGLDNFESRAVARTNARNWLQVIGREMGLEVRSGGGGGGYANATPISPSLSRMEMAAYGNDMADFREAYQEAIERAKEQGNQDPVDYVKRAFAARNPLRAVFKTSPSETQYRQILNELPSGGAQDVSDAVRTFNQFAENIGARPFEGRPEKQNPAETFRIPPIGNLASLRSRAGNLMLR